MSRIDDFEAAFGTEPKAPLPVVSLQDHTTTADYDAKLRRLGSRWTTFLDTIGDAGYPSASEADMAMVDALVKRNFTDGEIWRTVEGSARYRDRVERKGERHARRLYENEIAKARAQIVPFPDEPPQTRHTVTNGSPPQATPKAGRASAIGVNGYQPNDVADVTLVTHPAGDREIDGAALLDDIEAFLRRFVAYPSRHALVAHTLWLVHTHLMDAWESTPRLAALSPEPASGKTRLLEVSELLVPNPIEAVNVSAAYLFRRVGSDGARPTLLFDEIDTVFGPKAREHEDVRGLLNAGHRKGAIAGRCVVRGKTVETVDYPAYCAVALAGLGDLPDTILTRSVIIRMRRRLPTEHVEPYRRRLHSPEGHRIRSRIAAWANTIRKTVVETWPVMPDGVEDRDADVWEALLAVADAAGGEWPQRARAAATALVAEAKQSTPSLGIRLLTDLKTVFGNADVMATEDILKKLHDLEEAPWAELVAGKPLNSRGLAQRLKQYEVTSKVVRLGMTTARGYAREDLSDAWSRYLPLSPLENVTSVTNVTGEPAVTDVTHVTDLWGDEERGPS